MWNEWALDGNVTVAGKHLTNLVEGVTSMKDKIMIALWLSIFYIKKDIMINR